MSTIEKIAAVFMVIGFAALVWGVAMIHIPAAAIIAGVVLMVFGLALDRNAV